jgi:5-(carboxyamino)imidazole ribonucleotide synthase
MLSVAAARLGYRCHVFEPAVEAPAGDVAHQVTSAFYDDARALRTFAQSVDVVTYEFENVPAAALDIIEEICPIRPGRSALATSQDRLTEKTFLTSIGLKTAPFAAATTRSELEAALEQIGYPAILKTRRLGYDGKGQARIMAKAEIEAALSKMGGTEAILEGFVDFTREVSVIAARGIDGCVAAFDPGENIHVDGILRRTTVPARMSVAESTDAVLQAGRILNALDYVGVIGVEFFVSKTGLVVNEFAPRVHNSGHWTQNGCLVDQFEQHIRAITGWPLGDGSRYADVEMENLIGDDVLRIGDIATGAAAVHLYGKREIKAGRKMGHVNRVMIGGLSARR